MKKLVCIILCFVAMVLHVQAATIAENNPVREDVASGVPVVIDIGTGILRAGLSTSATPTVTLAHSFTNYGKITNWSVFESTLTQVFGQLGVSSANHPVIITESPLNPKSDREKIADVLFNKFNIPSLYIVTDAVLALYAADVTTGCIINTVENTTHFVPVYEGYVMPGSIIRFDIGGNDLADYMKSLLQNKGYTVSSAEAAAINNTLGYVAYDFQAEMEKAPAGIARSYKLSNGKNISVDKERFSVPEAMIQPAFLGIKAAGFHETAFNSIVKCDVDVRKTLFENIVLAGSNSLFPGMKERLEKEIGALAPPTMKVVVKALPNREYHVWTGGKKVVPLITSNNLWLTKAEFDAEGPSVVHKKFF